jgi:hypothetical protein
MCKKMSLNQKSQGHDKEIYKKLLIGRCNAIKNYVADLHGRLNQHLEK